MSNVTFHNEPWNQPKDDPQQDQLNLLQGINASLAQLVVIEQTRLDLQIKNMTPQIVNALIAALTALTALINTSTSNAAASAAAAKTAQDALTALQATDAALQDPALVKAANDAIAAATAVEPAVVPAVVPPVDTSAPPVLPTTSN